MKLTYEELNRAAKEVGLSFNVNNPKIWHHPGATHILERK
jgi:hypothetical protein